MKKRKIIELRMFVPFHDNKFVVGAKYGFGSDKVTAIEKTVMGAFVTLDNGHKIEICNTPFMIRYFETDEKM